MIKSCLSQQGLEAKYCSSYQSSSDYSIHPPADSWKNPDFAKGIPQHFKFESVYQELVSKGG